MPLRYLFQRLLNNEQLIERLSHWWPLRWAARKTAQGLVRSIKAAEEVVKSETTRAAIARGTSFSAKFREELKKGLEEINERKRR